MSVPQATTAALNIACFRNPTVDAIMKLRFRIYFLSNELNAIGGQNYLPWITMPVPPNSGPSLLNDSSQVTMFSDNGDPEENYDIAMTAIYYNNAINAGAAVSNVPTTIIQTNPQLYNLSWETLRQMEIFLLALLGRHKSYPQ